MAAIRPALALAGAAILLGCAAPRLRPAGGGWRPSPGLESTYETRVPGLAEVSVCPGLDREEPVVFLQVRPLRDGLSWAVRLPGKRPAGPIGSYRRMTGWQGIPDAEPRSLRPGERVAMGGGSYANLELRAGEVVRDGEVVLDLLLEHGGRRAELPVRFRIE